MPGHGEKYERKKDDAIVALLSHPTVEAAAKAIDVAPKTLHRWRQRPDFQAAYLKATNDNHLQAMAWLRQGNMAAATAIRKLTADPNVPASVRLASAKFTLTKSSEEYEKDVLEPRMTEMEQAIEQSQQNRHNQHQPFKGGTR